MDLEKNRHYFSPRLELIDLFEPLLDLADQFSCTMEMATYLAMLSVGGPKRFFQWYCDAASWKLTGTNTVPRKFQESFLRCNDDLELALLLMRTWFQSGSMHQKRDEWAKEWQINQKALMYAVEHKRDHLLAARFYQKSDEEFMRPVNLLLIPKIRLLIAYYIIDIERRRQKLTKGTAVRAGVYCVHHLGLATQPVDIHQDSVLYGRDRGSMKSFMYFFPDQERGAEPIAAQQVVYISPDWLDWLLQAERDTYDLAWYIARRIRYVDSIELSVQPDITIPRTRVPEKRRWNDQDTFLGQNILHMLKPFATQELWNGEGIRMKSYAEIGGVYEITGSPALENLAKLRLGKKYNGEITYVDQNFRQVRVRLPYGLSGIINESDMWGQWNAPGNDESISPGKTIPVSIKFINKQTGYVELDARLPELNPLRQFAEAQEVEGEIEQVGESPERYILVRIDDRTKPFRCLVHVDYGTNLRELYKVGERVTCRVKELIPDKEHILLEIVEQNTPPIGTE